MRGRRRASVTQENRDHSAGPYIVRRSETARYLENLNDVSDYELEPSSNSTRAADLDAERNDSFDAPASTLGSSTSLPRSIQPSVSSIFADDGLAPTQPHELQSGSST